MFLLSINQSNLFVITQYTKAKYTVYSNCGATRSSKEQLLRLWATQ